jgi:hypothetical protein
MTTNTGGPAFPSFKFVQSYGQMMALGGMTLRDYFAAKAMQGLLACPLQPQSGEDMYAKDAYAMADAMLKAREL